MKRSLVFKSPSEYSLLAQETRAQEPYHPVLEQLAQREVDNAFDERNCHLRDVFGQVVDSLRTTQESRFGEHNWNFQKPESGVYGPDDTSLHLVERRSDVLAGGDLVLTHVISVMQTRAGGRNHLFDLPTEGTDAERQIRLARWSISSAIDRCIAAGSADRFVLDKWVEGTFLPKR